MLSRLFTRRLLGIHAGAVVGMVACVLLGLWQWGRAAVTHSAQNGFYAFEWWSFAIILLVVWVRTVQDELRPAPHPDAPAGRGGIADPVALAAAAADAEGDEEMTAYNEYLAWLAAHPRD